MANKPPVHVELRENRWTVVREGSRRTTSVHPTQSDAAREGRELARRDETEFFLHARAGRVREHRNYGKESSTVAPGETEVLDQTTGTVGTLAGGLVGTAAQTAGAAGAAVPTAGIDAAQEAKRSGGTTDLGPNDGTSDEATNDAEEVHDLTNARQDTGSRAPEERYAGYEVYDRDGERIGRPDDLFVDENDNLEYLGVWTDTLGTRSVLIPMEVVTVEDNLGRMSVSRPNSVVQAGPSLEQDEELTPGLEEQVHRHYGLLDPPEFEGRGGGYGAYDRNDAERTGERGGADVAIPGTPQVPSEARDTDGREQDQRSLAEPGILEGDEEELKVRRSEEDLRVRTREREAGAVRVRKRVRTDRERLVVPKKRVEVTVERVPVVEGEAGGSEIREDEIVVPIIEEEVVVEKRPVVKEEIRIRKEVIEKTEVVEEDVRREEIEVDDQTERHDR